MKILISNDGPTAFYYIRLGLARAFSYCGHQVNMWDITKKPVHDAFDEFEPDLFLGQTYSSTKQVCDAIRERPHLKVIMKAGDWGSLADSIPNDFEILMASEIEKKYIVDLHEETGKPDYVHIYYHPSFIEGTHGYWKNAGVPIYSHMLAADVFDYTNGQKIPEFKSDLTFIGGYWPYKSQNIDNYLIPLCNDSKYKIKIFGNAHWPVAQYCGFAPMNIAKHILKSGTICPQIHEPHSTIFGFDMSERTFKLLSNKCFCISDYVTGLDYLFGENDSLLFAKTPTEFKEKVDYFLKYPEERLPYIERGYNKVMDNHTYFHRISDIFMNLGYEEFAIDALEKYRTLRNNIENENNII